MTVVSAGGASRGQGTTCFFYWGARWWGFSGRWKKKHRSNGQSRLALMQTALDWLFRGGTASRWFGDSMVLWRRFSVRLEITASACVAPGKVSCFEKDVQVFTCVIFPSEKGLMSEHEDDVTRKGAERLAKTVVLRRISTSKLSLPNREHVRSEKTYQGLLLLRSSPQRRRRGSLSLCTPVKTTSLHWQPWRQLPAPAKLGESLLPC